MCKKIFEWIYRWISIRIHPLDKRYFFLLFFPVDNSRFIGMHIHRRDRILDTRQTSESRGEMAHLNDQTVVPPRKNPYSPLFPPPLPGIMRPIFEAHRITIWIAKSRYVHIPVYIYIYMYITVASISELAGSHKFANCWSAVSVERSGSRSRGARD